MASDERLVLTPTDPRVPALRDASWTALRAAVPWAAVHEVGSTVLPDVPGKGDLDLLVLAPPGRFEETRAALDAQWPRNPAQHSGPDFQGYRILNPDGLDAAIQLTVAGGPHDTFLAFLDALRGDPGLRRAYGALKQRWDGQRMDLYRQDKASFVDLALASRAGGVRGAVARMLAVAWRDTVEVLSDEPSPCWLADAATTAGAAVPWCPVPAPAAGAPRPELDDWYGWWAHAVHARFGGEDVLPCTAIDADRRTRALQVRGGRVTVALGTGDFWFALDLATGRVERHDPPLDPVVVAPDLAAFARALEVVGA